MADTFNTDFTIQLFPKAPEQVPIRETIERVAGRMLGTERAEIDALQATVGDESSGLVKATDDLEAKVGDYTPAEFSNRTIAQDLSMAYTPIMKQGVRAKMDKIATGTDDLYETLENKHLVNPLLNDATGAHASYTITLTPAGEATGSITLTMRQIGDIGNDWIVKSSIGFEYNKISKEIVIDNSAVISTGQAFLDWYNGGTEYGADDLQEDIVVTYTGDMKLMLPDLSAPSNGEFAGGVDPHVVGSTGADLDATVDKSPTAGAPTIAQAYASAVLTAVATNPTEGDTVTVNDVIYTYVDELTEAYASATYTTDNIVPADGSTVVVNDQTYRFKSTMAQANDVQIAVTADGSLDNLKSAINTGYVENITFLGTVAATGVSASEVASHAITVTADAIGLAGNAFLKSASTDPDSHIDVDAGGDGTTFSGGVDAVANEIVIAPAIADTMVNTKKAINGEATEGINYSTGTEQPTDVTCAIDGTVVTCTATTIGTGGNAYPKAVEMATSDIAWDGTTDFFTGGADITAALAGAIRYDDDNVWISTSASAIDDSHWKRFIISDPTPLVLSIDDATGNYLLSAHNQTVIINMLEDTNGDPVGIALPAATGSGIEYRIANKHASDAFDIIANGTDVIDDDTTISLTTITSCILVDVADGIWAQF
jgi:hypothetical protein